jgi:hypothetical protein
VLSIPGHYIKNVAIYLLKLPMLSHMQISLLGQVVRRRTCNAKIARSIRVVGKVGFFLLFQLAETIAELFFCWMLKDATES